MYSVTIIGVGRVGAALARSLPSENYQIDSLVVRNKEQWEKRNSPGSFGLFPIRTFDSSAIRSDIVIIATQDSEIANVVEKIAPFLASGSHVFHTSGSLSSDILAPLRVTGCGVGSIHPLVSVSKGENTNDCFRDAYFCIEGDEDSVAIANAIVANLGGIPFTIDTDKKAMYHASAVMACGHLVALLDASFEMFKKCGIDGRLAGQIMMPLVVSTIRNLREQSPAEALTGPFARGDLSTIERHLRAMVVLDDPRLREIYSILGDRSLDLASSQGIDPAVIERIRDLIFMAKC